MPEPTISFYMIDTLRVKRRQKNKGLFNEMSLVSDLSRKLEPDLLFCSNGQFWQ